MSYWASFWKAETDHNFRRGLEQAIQAKGITYLRNDSKWREKVMGVSRLLKNAR